MNKFTKLPISVGNIIALAIVASALAGCSTMRLLELAPDYTVAATASICTRTNAQAALLSPLDNAAAVLPLSPDDAANFQALSRVFSLQAVNARFAMVTTTLPSKLANDKVVIELLKSVKSAVNRSQKSTVQRIGLESADHPSLLTRGYDAVDGDGKLDELDFNTFGSNVRQTLFSSPMAYGASSGSAPPAGDSVFYNAFVGYFSAYYKGDYVERFGTKLPKPIIARTIGNTEIAGAVTVFVDLLLDYVLQTPVWQDNAGDGSYYPGAIKKDAPPTAVVEQLALVLPLLKDSQSDECGITKLKAEAIQYLASAASSQASAMGGLVGGSFGGLNFGLGVLGKFSIGDNQTLGVLVKTSLGQAFERGGEEASYRVLYWMKYVQGDKLWKIIQYYLDHQGQSGSQN